MAQKKTKLVPRLSVSKMAEYQTAGPNRRRRIILDAKDPQPYIVGIYEYAKDAITEYLAGDELDAEGLLKAIDEIAHREPQRPSDAKSIKLCCEALERFVSLFKHGEDLAALKRSKGAQASPKLVISEVEISIQPDVILKGAVNVTKTIGAIKLVFGKSEPLTPEHGESIALMLQEHITKHLSAGMKVDPRICMVLDVFSGRVFYPPKAVKRRMANILASCEEIKAQWRSIAA